MRDPLSQVRIRYKLPLTFLVICLVAFGIGGVVLTSQARGALEAQIAHRLDERAAAVHVVVERHLDLHKRRAEDFASDGFIRAELAHLVEADRAKDASAVTAAQEALERHLRVNKLPLVAAFVGALLYDAQGRLRVQSPAGFGAFLPGGQVDLTTVGPLRSAEAGYDHATFRITTPLTHQSEEHAIGALQLVVAARTWANGMEELAQLPPVGAESLRLIGGSGVELDLRGDEAAAGHGPQDVFGYRRSVAQTDWRIEVEVDRQAALAPAVHLRNQYLIIGLVLLLVTAGVLFFPVRFLLQPLSSIAEAARRIAQGDFSARVAHDSGDEIGDLARGFNTMAVAVEERTGQLEQAAAALRRSEEEIRLERDRLAAVLRQMEDGLFILGADGSVLLANHAAEPLLAALEAQGQGLRRLECGHAQPPAEGCLGCLGRVQEEPEACVVEQDGRIYEIRTRSLPVAEGSMPSRLCVGRDVTTRIAAQESQAHQERMTVLGEVAAVMAHELNNPLAAISMFSQMMQQQVEAGTPLRENVDVIQRNVQHCKRTIASLLDLAARGTIETSSFDVCDLLADVVQVLHPIHHRAGVSVEVCPCAGDFGLQGDEVRLRQVFINLVMNAVQAVGRGGTVRVAVRQEGDDVEVRVVDDGPGIPAALRERIFEPFFTTKAAGVGTGLGLSTSRRIVGEHGGQLVLESTGAEGATFTVRLPRKTARHGWQAEARMRAPVGATGSDAGDGDGGGPG